MNEGNCRYFVTYTGIGLPLNLVSELDEAGLGNRNTYFRACFDEDGRISSCQKIVYGEVEMEHRYEYHDNGTLSLAEITDADGDCNVLRFSTDGERLE